jgi:hypothetical protein
VTGFRFATGYHLSINRRPPQTASAEEVLLAAGASMRFGLTPAAELPLSGPPRTDVRSTG